MKPIYMFLVLLCWSTFSQGQAYPFPQNLAYTSGSIKPNHKTTAQLNSDVEQYYNAWKAKYIKNCSGKYYVDFTDENPAYITTSESHGYGMMIVALIAGYDANAKIIFDGMYDYYKAHYSSINNKLMSWQQGSCANPGGNDDAATDGDLDIGYALLLADAQWGSAGAINYINEAKAIINASMASETHPSSYHPLLGDWVSSPSDLKLSRSSDFLPDHFKAFQFATGDIRWNNVYEKIQALIAYLQSSTANPALTGLLPDFIQNADTPTPTIPTGQVLETPQDGWYNWNACRDPWRIGTGYLMTGDPRSKTAANMIINWLVNKSTVPANFTCVTRLDGSGTSTGELAFVAPYMVGMMVDASHQAVLNNTYDWVMNASITSFTYFHNTIKMLCLMTATGNYWSPGLATGSQEVFLKPAILLHAFVSLESDEFILHITTNSPSIVSVAVFDESGKQLTVRQEALINGSNSIHLPDAMLSNGLYFVSITTNGERKTLKFIKNR
jgi:endo-1,4-beta-D-glucanase Y